MTAKPLQLTVAILAGALLGVFATHLLLRRDGAQPSASPPTENRKPEDNPKSQIQNSKLASPISAAASPPTQKLKPTTQILSVVPVSLTIAAFTENRSQVISPSAFVSQSSGLRLELVFSGEVKGESAQFVARRVWLGIGLR